MDNAPEYNQGIESEIRLIPNPRIISISGVDGSGKSSVARFFTAELSKLVAPFEVHSMNGSRYDAWGDETYTQRLKYIDPHIDRSSVDGRFFDSIQPKSEKFNRLRAFACYRRAQDLATQGVVSIDSDPVMKYLLRHLVVGEDVTEGIKSLRLKGGAIPGTIIHVTPTDDPDKNAELIAERLQMRQESGEKLSPYDPTTDEQIRKLLSASDQVVQTFRDLHIDGLHIYTHYTPGLRVEDDLDSIRSLADAVNKTIVF